MKLALPINQVDSSLLFGGKAYSLAVMAKSGFRVPQAVCISTKAYDRYVDSTGLRGRIMLELGRKRLEDMRWEEIWDASLRIRNLFAGTPMPEDLETELRCDLLPLADKEVVVRSSALGEDSAKTSFAGIHESYVNIRSLDSILKHVKLVWASLWSDAAILYRRELDLDVEKSSMAVLVQEIIVGNRSGVAFSQSPSDPKKAMIEAVFGLNQGLVDGTVEPDRWTVDRKRGTICEHHAPKRETAIFPSAEGVKLQSLSPEMADRPPLSDGEVAEVFSLACRAERLFGLPQDIEWTVLANEIYMLQSRPITTIEKDERTGYMALRRSLKNLQSLRKRIEQEIIPGMNFEAAELATMDIAGLSDQLLAQEIERRAAIFQKWHDIYWQELIPFAHGARLFGRFYNDALQPSDPYEFLDLLAGSDMMSLKRNKWLQETASRLRNDPDLAKRLERGEGGEEIGLDGFLDEYALLADARPGVIRVLLEMAKNPPKKQKDFSRSDLEEQFLSHFSGDERSEAREILDLGKASYKMRDDDNIFLGRIEAQLESSLQQARQRLKARGLPGESVAWEEAVKALKDPGYIPIASPAADKKPPRVLARQIVGQPAGPGVGTGRARVVVAAQDLFDFKAKEVLVCDSLDPTMTFVVPLASAIVERRGGMLVHGSIIAREYEIPCVTGVQGATEQIRTGDWLTVDGTLGIVTIERRG